jgi:hypothetical protein
MIRFLITLAICSLGLTNASSQTLPREIRQILDARYPGWQLIKYERPIVPDYPESSIFVDSEARNLFICRLNLDDIPDYAMGIRLPHDARPREYFVAAVSSGFSYELFPLDSSETCCQGQMLLSPHGAQLNIFGDIDSAIANYGKLSPDGDYIEFPTDCVNLTTIIQSSRDINFVFIGNRFYGISSGD